ncbi:MAG: SDR family oxidoreductase [Firmicutes bacterium]|nr:SDR family oxidoreductase [Bacillota bacterium]
MTLEELFSCRNRVVLITGGSRGLGRVMAEALAEAGADVAVCSRKREACLDTVESVRTHGREAIALACDVTQPGEVDRAVDTILQEWGRIDVLINNSGTSWGAPALDMPLDAWHKVLDTNLTGSFLMSQRVARHMIPNGGGKIINIASIAGLKGFFPEGLDAVGYSASKGGVVALTRDLAVKWGRYGVTVNAIAPGFFPTKMSQGVLDQHGDYLRLQIPLGRFGSSDDLRGVIVFLASPASNYLTGSVLVVDGGMTA